MAQPTAQPTSTCLERERARARVRERESESERARERERDGEGERGREGERGLTCDRRKGVGLTFGAEAEAVARCALVGSHRTLEAPGFRV